MEKKSRGSWFYRSYHAGYEPREVCLPDGRVRSRMVYTGDYYTQDVSDREHRLLLALHTLFALGALGLHIFAGVQPTIINLYRLSIVSQMLLTLALVFQCFALFQYWLAPRNMTYWSYRSSSRFLRLFSLVAAICSGLVLVSGIVGLVLLPVESLRLPLFCLAAYALCGLCCLASNYLESRVPYKIAPNGGER